MTSKLITIPKRVMIVFLAAFFTLAFIVTPYWRSVESRSGMTLILALTIFIGAVWLALVGGDFQIRMDPSHWGFFLILLVISMVLNFKPLTSVIPWRGDEDYFMSNTLALASSISTKWLLVFFAAFLLLAYLAWQKTRWTIPVGVFLFAGIILLMWFANPFTGIKDTVLFRYPYLNYWFFAFLPKLALLFRVEPYYEILFRVIPFITSIALVWLCQTYFMRPARLMDLLWGCAVITLPLLYYYSSILYLELPALFLMTLVCFNIQSLFHDDFTKLQQNPAWYALILIGFIKETTVLFLLCFVFWRWIAFLMKRQIADSKLRSFGPDILQEIKVALAVLLPVVLYVFLRSFQTRNRSFSPDIANLVTPDVLHAIGQSLIDQTGLFLVLFLAGGFLLLFEKEYLVFGFFASIFLLYPFFFAVDAAGYAGYSRFNLYILAPILGASGIFVRELLSNRKLPSLVLAGIILLVNLWSSPINLDGTKKPLWGVYLADTSEHYYPYREALEWLKANHNSDRILFTGMHYPYISFAFYFSKLNWEPDHEIRLTEKRDDQEAAISEALARAEAANFNVVLYQITGNEIPQIDDSHNFVEEKIFKNDAHTLIIYSRTLTSAKGHVNVSLTNKIRLVIGFTNVWKCIILR